jgi:hypothetical protein
VGVAVFDVTSYAGAAALIQQGARIAAHQQQRHQVFEHRPAPRHQRRAAVDVRDEAPHMKPVMLRHVALCDGDEAGQPRFGGQQVVEGPVRPCGTVRVGEAVSNREDAAAAVVEKVEPHGVGERGHAPRQRGE